MERSNADSIASALKSLPPIQRLSRHMDAINSCPGEELWRSDRHNDLWSKPYKLPAPLNSDKNDAMMAVSVDKTTAYTFRNGRIMIRRLQSDGARGMPVDALNSGQWSGDVCLSSDGRALLLCSNREGSTQLGPNDTTLSRDIYVSIRDGENWSKPLNLGSTINTSGTECSPFLHSDGKTQYFSLEARIVWEYLDDTRGGGTSYATGPDA